MRRWWNARMIAALACCALTACFDERGTYAISLIESPDAPVLANITRLVVTVDDPVVEREVVRNTDGAFAISLDVAADDRNGQVALIGYDAADNVIAVGATPPVPWSARNGELRIFMAAPETFATLPEHISVPRTRMAATPALGGVAIVGGVDAQGTVRDEVALYSAFTHRLVDLSPLPAPRADAGLVWDALGRLHVFGGVDGPGEAAAPTATWSLLGGAGTGFQTLNSSPTWARAVPLATLGERYVIAPGMTSLLLDTQAGQGAFMTVPQMAGQVISADSLGVLCIGAGCGEEAGSGAVAVTLQSAHALAIEVAAGAPEPNFTSLTQHRLAHHAGVTYVVGGERQGQAALDMWAVKQTAAQTLQADRVATLTAARLSPAVAVVGSWLVVAGGYDPVTMVPLATADLIALSAPHATRTVPLAAPRGNAVLIALGSGDALLVGGTTTDGAPLAALELFALARYH